MNLVKAFDEMENEENLRELDPDELCGCGSGERYSKCHATTTEKYFRDPNGDIVHQIPISEELEGVLLDTKTRFSEIFGREPSDSDPVFFERFLLGQDSHFYGVLLDTARAADIDDELVYAWQKTGIMLAEQNLDKVSPKDKQGLAQGD